MNPFTYIAALAGFGLVTLGAFLVYRPLGALVAGALLLVAAYGSMRSPK